MKLTQRPRRAATAVLRTLARHGGAPILVAVSVVGLGILYGYQQSQASFLDKHGQTEARIAQLRASDSEWSSQILRVQAGMATNFDALTLAAQNTGRSRDAVVTEARGLGLNVDGPGFVQLEAALRAKFDSAERLKSEHAILSNSLRFLPTQLEQLEREIAQLPPAATTQGEARALSLDVNELTREVLRSVSQSDASSLQRVAQATERVRQRMAKAPTLASLGQSSELLAMHAGTVVEHRHAAESATTLALAAPSAAAVDAIAAEVGGSFRQRLAAADRLRLYVFAAALLVAAAALYTTVGWVRNFRALRRANRHLADQLEQTSNLMRQTDELKDVAARDPLTGLINRSLLHDRLERALSRAIRSRQVVAVVFIDLDGFKPVNDTHGHDVGDELLIEVARRLRRNMRDSDTAARLGGDEFVLILESVSKPGALRVANAVLSDIAAIASVEGRAVEVSASLGVAVWESATGPVPDPKELLTRADRAMYIAKRAGKGQIRAAGAEPLDPQVA